MHTGTCDRCGASSVFASANSLSGQSNHTTMWPPHRPEVKGIVRAHQGQVWQYVCVSCGVMEWRVHDPATLQWIAANWVAVRPPEAQPPP
ncbi:hypothetical protein [Nocardioides stalactiti]|uniref:hypothetical protein n=1 Tax=Nocardioides stalactiti TaxID=2755356 RepID=UPI001603CFC5|nr:hypothetical protein [Nocardioides stalactiti]